MRLAWTSQAWASCAAKILTSSRRVSALYDYTQEETIRNRVIRAWHCLIMKILSSSRRVSALFDYSLEEMVRNRAVQAWRGLISKILVLGYRVAASKVLDIILARTPTMVNCMRALARSDDLDLAWEVASAAMAASDPPAPARGRTAFMNRCAERLRRSDVAAEGSWTVDLKLELESKIAELEAKVKSLEEAPETAVQESSSSTAPTTRERWATVPRMVEGTWAGYPTPWWCYRCAAEWVRAPPRYPALPPPDSPRDLVRPPPDSPGWV